MNPDSDLQDFIVHYADCPPHRIALLKDKFPHIDIPFAIEQIQGRQIAREKMPQWYACPQIVYPPHLNMEQATCQQAAQYKAGLFKGGSMLDLTGGVGADFVEFAKNFSEATYIDSNSELVELAKQNFPLLGLQHFYCLCADAKEYLPQAPAFDFIYLDPARRSGGRKQVLLQDCQPNVADMLPLLLQKGATVAVKLSPMLDITAAINQLHHTAAVYVISCLNECKEILFVFKNDCPEEPVIHCVNIDREASAHVFSFSMSEEKAVTVRYAATLQKYLYLPNASLLKAGCYKLPAQRFELEKLAPSSHLYTSRQFIVDFPGKIYEIIAAFDFNRQTVNSLHIQFPKANIAVRNFPLSASRLQERLKIADGGNTFIFATTLCNNKKVLLICSRTDL